MIAMDDTVFKSAAQVTGAFGTLLLLTMMYQGVSKTIAASKTTKEKRVDRYNLGNSFVAIDRSVANLVEWCPVFLIFFWLSMILTGGQTLIYGWIYVAARAIYPVLAVSGGVSATRGLKPFMGLSTLPGYLCLFVFMYHTFINTM